MNAEQLLQGMRLRLQFRWLVTMTPTTTADVAKLITRRVNFTGWTVRYNHLLLPGTRIKNVYR
ncbi:hypothetical protein Ciccas_006666 [Cichlidogyrus casuarinus]|uniref:Uncharacterized protein n=1 Tax=Cichlidogyrus casuarinus TaxID=1844966 RepID=A0ABD2Q558_9PLAT